jgi:hypothetical protein
VSLGRALRWAVMGTWAIGLVLGIAAAGVVAWLTWAFLEAIP